MAKDVKFLVLQKGIRIYQYLDDWLVRARSHQTSLKHTQTLVALCQELGWLVNKDRSELEPKQVFSFVGYQFDLMEGRIRPTQDRWQTLQAKNKRPLDRSGMSSPEANVPANALRLVTHETHLKNNWRVPETLEKVIPIPKRSTQI